MTSESSFCVLVSISESWTNVNYDLYHLQDIFLLSKISTYRSSAGSIDTHTQLLCLLFVKEKLNLKINQIQLT